MKLLCQFVGWLMHYVVGMVCGCVIGWGIVGRRHHGFILVEEAVFWFVMGCAFIAGSVGAHMGDRLWLRKTAFIIPPDGLDKHPLLIALTVGCFMVGLMSIVWAFFIHIRAFNNVLY